MNLFWSRCSSKSLAGGLPPGSSSPPSSQLSMAPERVTFKPSGFTTIPTEYCFPPCSCASARYWTGSDSSDSTFTLRETVWGGRMACQVFSAALRAFTGVTAAEGSTVAVKSSESFAASRAPPTVMPVIVFPVLFCTLITRRVRRCWKTIATAFAEGMTPVFEAARKSEEEVPAVWSAWTVNDVGTPLSCQGL